MTSALPRNVIHNFRGRAQAIVLMYVDGILDKEGLVKASQSARITKEQLLIAADWLAKNMELKRNPFPWTEYRDSDVNISAHARKDLEALRWCSRCGQYQSIISFYKYDDPTGKKPYSHLCREHHLEKQAESDERHSEEIKERKRKRYLKQKRIR